MTKSRPRPVLDAQAGKKLRIQRRIATRIVVEVGVSVAGDERMLDRFARWFQIRYHRFREPMAGIDRLSARESCQCQVSRSLWPCNWAWICSRSKAWISSDLPSFVAARPATGEPSGGSVGKSQALPGTTGFRFDPGYQP